MSKTKELSYAPERQPTAGNAKGTMFIGALKSLKRLPGFDRIKDSLPENVQPYITQRVLPSRWYPEEDWVALLEAFASLLELNRSKIAHWPKGLDVWEFIGRGSVDEFAKGPYNTFLGPGPVSLRLQHFGSFWSLRHNTGSIEIEHGDDDRSAALRLRGYSKVSTNQCRVIEGSIWRFLNYNRSSDEEIRVQKAACKSEGSDHCCWQISWQ
jgi:hypothetical protein